MDFRTYTREQWLEDEENLLKQLEDHNIYEKIPLLNVNELYNLKDSRLVRFRGMIQDMHSSEFYFEKFEVISLNQKTNEKFYRNGKYCDSAVSSIDECVNFDSKENVTSERQSYVVISVPGINDWVKTLEEDKYQLWNILPFSSKQIKRSYEETMDTTNNVDNQEPSTSVGQKKICKEETSVENKPTLSFGQTKICKEEIPSVENKPTLLSKESILNFPFSDRPGKVCHVKIYKNSDELKLNDVYEFLGFLAIDPLIEASYQEIEDIDKMEMETLHPPSSLVPRIHCVNLKKLAHYNPLLSTLGTFDTESVMDLHKINYIREKLLTALTQLLLGDKLAAEYLIFHLISKVYLRRDVMALGKFSLNISNIPQLENIDFVKELYNFIEEFIPKSHYLPLTLENMNQLSFIPKKDYECNRLISGILQLSHNTHLVLDETKLCPGKLDSVGVNNLKAISSAIKKQKVTYDFNYYPLEFDCDIPFLILSEGKSMINVDVHVVLKPEKIYLETFNEVVAATKHFLNLQLLDNIRKYLTLARLFKYEISTNIEEVIQREFVDMRRRGVTTADDLHSLLVLARLVCVSRGKTTLDEECWKKAYSLEKERKARFTK